GGKNEADPGGAHCLRRCAGLGYIGRGFDLPSLRVQSVCRTNRDMLLDRGECYPTERKSVVSWFQQPLRSCGLFLVHFAVTRLDLATIRQNHEPQSSPRTSQSSRRTPVQV